MDGFVDTGVLPPPPTTVGVGVMASVSVPPIILLLLLPILIILSSPNVGDEADAVDPAVDVEAPGIILLGGVISLVPIVGG